MAYTQDTNVNSLVGMDVTIAGYPLVKQMQQWTAHGPVTRVDTVKGIDGYNYSRLYYTIDILRGDSGAPVYSAGYIARGVSAMAGSTENWGPVINKIYFDWIKGYI